MTNSANELINENKIGVKKMLKILHPAIDPADLRYLTALDSHTRNLPNNTRTDLKIAIRDVYHPGNIGHLGLPRTISDLHRHSADFVEELIDFLTHNYNPKDEGSLKFLAQLRSHLNSKPDNDLLAELERRMQIEYPNIIGGELNKSGMKLPKSEQLKIKYAVSAIKSHFTLWHQLSLLVNKKNAR